MDRRRFLKRLEVLSATALGGALLPQLAGCGGWQFVDTAVAGNRLVVRRADVGDAAGVLVEAPGLALPIYLHRAADGRFTAVSTRCMHRGCQVEPRGGRLVCPCHGSEYSYAGAILQGPTELPLVAYPVTTDAEHVFIELPAVERA